MNYNLHRKTKEEVLLEGFKIKLFPFVFVAMATRRCSRARASSWQ